MKVLVLLGAFLASTSAHLFTYDDSAEDGHFSPSFYVSKNPPGKHGQAPWGKSSYYQPSYYVSKTLPRWPNKPHGTGPVYTYPPTGPSYRSDWSPLIRQGRSKSKKAPPAKGGWWYKWQNGKLITGRWGAPPPPGLEKEHYIYGGGWGGQSYHSQSGGWGWPQRQHGWGGGHGHHGGHGHGHHGGHGHGHGHGHHGFGGPHFSKKSPHHKPSHHGIGPGFHITKWSPGGHGGYGGGGGWGWPQPQRQHGWGW